MKKFLAILYLLPLSSFALTLNHQPASLGMSGESFCTESDMKQYQTCFPVANYDKDHTNLKVVFDDEDTSTEIEPMTAAAHIKVSKPDSTYLKAKITYEHDGQEITLFDWYIRNKEGISCTKAGCKPWQ